MWLVLVTSHDVNHAGSVTISPLEFQIQSPCLDWQSALTSMLYNLQILDF